MYKRHKCNWWLPCISLDFFGLIVLLFVVFPSPFVEGVESRVSFLLLVETITVVAGEVFLLGLPVIFETVAVILEDGVLALVDFDEEDICFVVVFEVVVAAFAVVVVAIAVDVVGFAVGTMKK